MADGRVSPTQSLTEFLDLLGGLSQQQRACVALRRVGGSGAQVRPLGVAVLI